MKSAEVHTKAEQIKKRERNFKIARYLFFVIILLLGFLYVSLAMIYSGGGFSVMIHDDLFDNGIVIYERRDDFDFRRRLSAAPLDYMDNISINWLPDDIATRADGPHNGDNFVAYSFFIENRGERVVNYWKEVFIDSVTRNVDRSIRIMIIPDDGEREVFAKRNTRTGDPEIGTIPFNDEDKIIARGRMNFTPGEIDRYTIVIWLEGDDEDTVNDLIGGQIQMSMTITGEVVS